MKKDKGCTLTLPCLQVDEVTCQTCRYFGEPYCSNVALKDAMKRIEQLEAERDAAHADLEEYVKRIISRTGGIYACAMCKHYRNPYSEDFFKKRCPKGCEGYKNWEWRGVQPKEDEHD